ncbi:MAG: Nif3-like dinuclear metal center hexameric protein [Bacteroidales bacterium]|nr:Nif3-like dinuclear metal center hexameric protein [Bacteroidales bacterium]
MKAKDIMAAIEQIAPRQLQEDYDNAGLQCGNPQREVKKVLCCLDVTEEVVKQAIDQNFEMIVSHHPLLFRGVKCISAEGDYISRCLYGALTHDIVIYAAHTNLDNAPMGVNKMMADLLGLCQQQPLAPLPLARLAGLDASFAAECGSGMIGDLPHAMSADDFVSLVKETFSSDAVRLNTDMLATRPKTIRRVALCGGSGSEFIADAERQGADAFLTGEVGYHRMFGHPDILLVEAGHFETEHKVAHLLATIIKDLGIETCVL